MKFDDSSCTLTFRSLDEASAFHLELTSLVRQAMLQASKTAEDADDLKGPSKAVMQEHAHVLRALNAMRKVLPRHGV